MLKDMDYYSVKLDYTYDDLVGWLRTLDPETIVHDDTTTNLCKDCTVARFLQDKLDDPTIEVGYNTADTKTDENKYYALDDWFGYAVTTLDRICSVYGTGDERKLTAAKALEILENLDRKS